MDSRRPLASQGAEAVSVDGAPTTNIFKLPRKIRDRIYEMVLRVPHPLYLFQETDTLVETFAPERPLLWTALLYTNRQIKAEASAALYGTNKFSLLEMTPKEAVLFKSFLCGIGPVNAGFITYLCLSFPSLEAQAEHCRLREDSAEIMALLREQCTSLNTLELGVHSKNCSWLIAGTANTSTNIPEALAYIDRQLKAVATVEQILVRVVSGTLAPSASTTLRDLGWLTLAGNGG